MKIKYSSTKSILFVILIGLFSIINNQVKAQCQSSFVYNPGPNGTVYFVSTSTAQDSITTYIWSFGDNQFATVPNPVHTYTLSGVYDVCLIIYTANQTCVDTICQQLTVTNASCFLLAGIASDSIAGTLSAVATMGAMPYTYLWSNGSTQPVINPTIVGNYCVTVTDANGCSSTACHYWYGNNCNYGFTINYGIQGVVNFITYGTNGQPVTWDFGDGTAQFTTAATYFSHTYSQSGTYQVCISMPGCLPYCAYVTVNVALPCSGVSANIVSQQNNTFLIAEVFNANLPVTYLWTSGDTSQAINTNGVSTFCVTITDALGCTATDCITVNPNCNMIVLLDTITNPGGITPTVINGVAPYTYLWNNNSTQPVFYATVGGSYCVLVTDAMGCSATACAWSNGSPFCNYGYTYNTPNQGTATFFSYGANNQPITWDFGDGSPIITSAAPLTTHTFANSGVYTVCITVGNCAPFCTSVSINIVNPCTNFTADILSYQNNTYLGAITNNGTGPFSYSWSTGDTAQGIATIVGTVTYCVTITDASGCTATDCIAINPNCNILVNIINDSIAGTMTAVATNGGGNYYYQWSNGSSNQVITPTIAGNYCVTVSDSLGCSASNCSYWYTNLCNVGYTYTYQGPGQVVFITYNLNGLSATWDFGDGTPPLTTNQSQLMHPYTVAGTYTVCMTVAGCNPVCYSVYANVPGNSQICGNVFNDNNSNSVIDLGDSGVDSTYVYLWGGSVSQTATTDSLGNYSFLNLNPGTYYIQFCTYNLPNYMGVVITVPAVDTAMCATYTVTIGANDTICGNNFGVYNNSSEISGTLFLDANNNGTMDVNESGLPYQLIQIGTNYTYTDWNGNYNIWLIPGNYTVSYTTSGNYINGIITTPTSYQINITGPGNYYANNNFGVYMPPGMNDLSVVITPHTTVTPGFPAWYDINVCNYGSSATGATVTMIYDPVLNTNYQSPSGIVNTTNHTITWNIANINPYTCINIWTSFVAQVGIQLGAGTLEFVMVTPTSGIDNNQTNNTDTVHQTIVGSWDPNNKIVVKTNNVSDPSTHFISSVNADQEIIYTINFQNTGNAPAVNVVVIDEMASELNTNSYQFVNASHNCDVIRIGNTVTYRFMNIMLPDSVNDEPNSHGFINFKINATNGLTMGTQIVDFANIYFDFNDPVLTNDAVVTLIDVTGAADLMSNPVVIYPNPAKESFNVSFNSNTTGNASIVMYDNTGRKVTNQQVQINVGQNKTNISTNSLENGLYFIEMIQPNGAILKNVISIQK
jgi:uncharacterized repeat protein (TIGR01451 family)